MFRRFISSRSSGVMGHTPPELDKCPDSILQFLAVRVGFRTAARLPMKNEPTKYAKDNERKLQRLLRSEVKRGDGKEFFIAVAP